MATNEALTDDPVTETPPEIRREATVMELAQVVAESRSFPDCRTSAAAAVRILAGKEMGVGPIASVIGIRIQAGRVSMDAALLAGIIKRSGRYDYEIQQHDAAACDILFSENGKPIGHSVFTMTDAKTAGLANKDTWKAYPRNMLFSRALTNGARWFCPAIFGGAVYSHEELGYAVDEEGRAIENGSPAGGGNDLCTRDQRAEITRLLEAAGKTLASYTEGLGIRLLDELSGQEADKEIKKLAKMAAKKADGGKPSNTAGKAPVVSPDHGPAKDVTEPTAPASQTIPASQQTLIDAQEESRLPSTVDQKRRIIELAEALGLETDDIKAVLAKRNCEYISQLSHLQAAALIEGMEGRLEAMKQQPPFEPTN